MQCVGSRRWNSKIAALQVVVNRQLSGSLIDGKEFHSGKASGFACMIGPHGGYAGAAFQAGGRQTVQGTTVSCLRPRAAVEGTKFEGARCGQASEVGGVRGGEECPLRGDRHRPSPKEPSAGATGDA